MRKINPNDVIDDFKNQMSELDSYFDHMATAIKGKPNEKANHGLLAEQTFVAAAAAFEGFLSDLFVALVNRDPSKFQAEFETRILTSVREKHGDWHANRLKYSKVKHLKAADVEVLLDPKGGNKTFSGAKDLKAQAQCLIVDTYSKKLRELNDDDGSAIDCVKAVRDFIVHRSRSSKDRMNSHLAAVAKNGLNQNLGRGAGKIHKVGAFLKAAFQHKRRVQLYCGRLQQIADSLRI